MSYQLLPRDASSSPIPQPITTSLPSSSGSGTRRGRALAFFGTAAATGVLFHLLLLGFGSGSGSSPAGAGVSSVKDWWKGDPLERPPPPPSAGEDWSGSGGGNTKTCAPTATVGSGTEAALNVSTSYIRPGLGQYVTADEDEWSMERIRKMVEGTKGYYARDYSLGLGWNNMRYIVETSLLHADLLNRTLILPSFVYARACEWNITVCASYADMVNRGDAVGWGEWRELPIEQQMGWRIPIDVMLDLRKLRHRVPVVTISEYLQLHGLSPSLEWSNGAWQREAYHTPSPSPSPSNNGGHAAPSLGVIQNWDYDPSGVVRVDVMPPPARRSVTEGPVYQALMDAKGSELAVKLDDVKSKLQGIASWKTEEELEALIEDHGFVVLHTFAGALGMDYLKSVTEPIKQVALRASLRGLVDDYDGHTEDVLLLEGETHLNRKPGSLRFTSAKARADFQDIVLHGLIHIAPIEVLADRVAERMLKLNDGRMWMAGHMRRGDFVRLSWAMENTVEAHFDRIKSRLHNGAAKLKEVFGSGEPLQIPDVPFVVPDKTFVGREAPRDGDKFYIATDERSPAGLKYIRSHGAVMISDLLFPEDRRLVGWPLLYTDVLALLEQSVMAHAAYFYAHAMSSVAGGVVNLRGARGLDPRFTLID